jgi:hypothetical protein
MVNSEAPPERGDSKESRSGSSDRLTGKRSSESLNPNPVSSEVATKHRAFEENDKRSRSKLSDGTRKRSSSSHGTKDVDRRSNAFNEPRMVGERDRASSASRSTRGNRPKSPGDRMTPKSPSTRPKSPSIRNRRRVSSVAASKIKDSLRMVDGSPSVRKRQ